MKFGSQNNIPFGLIAGLFVVCGMAACNNSIDPIDTENGIFAVYGTLDLNKDTNYIRVRDLNAPFTEETTQQIDAEVVLENLDSRVSELLTNQRVYFDGIYEHNFVAQQDILPNTEYKITVTRSDGRTLALNTTTPTYPQFVAEPVNQDCYTPIEIKFDPIYNSTVVLFIELTPIPHPVLFDSTFTMGPFFIRNDSLPGTKGTLTITPIDLVHRIPRAPASFRCTELQKPILEVFYLHYSKGFYEQFIEGDFEVVESTQRFGAFYFDTYNIPIDTSRVCPPDCL